MTDAPLTALVLLFEGFEEIEAFTPVDLLSRAGITVTLANIDSGESVTGRSGITVQTTQSFETLAAQKFDCLILPGGPGIAKLRKHPLLCETLREYHQSKRILGCICAAPLLLLDAGILPGPAYTCHPAAEDELSDASQQAGHSRPTLHHRARRRHRAGFFTRPHSAFSRQRNGSNYRSGNLRS
jgi:4-methyl-5(b-hydroxyethyl)-thiazole monophosphate biosynthesis